MNRDEYLRKLKLYLKSIPEEEIAESLYDVEEYFNLAYEDNKSDEDIIKVLGSPEKLAKSIKLDFHLENSDKSNFNIKQILSIIGLGFANIILLPLFLSIGCVIFLLHVCVWLLFLSSAIAFLAGIVKFMVPNIHLSFISLPSNDPFIITVIASVIFLVAFISNKVVNTLTRKGLSFLNEYYKKNNDLLKYSK